MEVVNKYLLLPFIYSFINSTNIFWAFLMYMLSRVKLWTYRKIRQEADLSKCSYSSKDKYLLSIVHN